MKVRIPDLLSFAIANALGFTGSSIAYHLAIALDLFKPTEEMIASGALKELFFRDTAIVWIGCALLSTAYFFEKRKIRMLFLGMPALLPFFYGFSVLLRMS